MSTSATWLTVSIGLPPEVQEALEKVNETLETVSTVLELVIAILEVIKVFLVDVTNPLAAILRALLAIVENLVNDLRQTGLYLWADIPDPDHPEGFAGNLKGGMPAWRGRMAYALLAPGVENQPNFSNTASVVSLHMVVSVGNISDFITQFGFLIALFKQQATPKFNPPMGLVVRPINQEFYTTYYNTTTGLIDAESVESAGQTLVQSPDYSSHFLSGANALQTTQVIDEEGNVIGEEPNIDLQVRYDFLTGEEMLVDVNSGAVLTNGGTPDSALLTWKLDQKLIPRSYRIERSLSSVGDMETYEEKNARGVTISTEKVRDVDGEPVITAEEIGSVSVSYGFAPSVLFSGSPTDQVAYLDTDVDPGVTYYYRVVSVYGSGLSTSLPSITPNSPAIARVVDLIRSILKATSGEGYTSFKGCYIPTETDGELIRYTASQAALQSPPQWWMDRYASRSRWEKVGVGDLLEPVITAVESLRNFVEMMLAAIEGIVDQIVAFIELLQTKLYALNTFIELLQALIALLSVFELLSFGTLFVTTDEGTSGVLRSVNDEALAGVPTPGASDYVGSMTILGGTAGVGAALNAIKLLFGIDE
tara:strand:- start:8552 stop:10327 length:1776 start_codon:yes stop_codon:yes gene_type:complete